MLVNAGVGLSETLFVTAYLGYANETDTLDRSLRVDYYGPVEGLALLATIGDNESWRYWTVGANYALTESLKADVTWHDTNLVDTKGLLVGGLTFSF